MKTTNKLLIFLLAALLLLAGGLPSACAEAPRYTFAETPDGLFAIDADGGVCLVLKEDWANESRIEEVLSWTDIVSIAGDYEITAGLRKDGTVLSARGYGVEERRVQEMSGWRDIVQIVAAYDHVIALRSDGAVLSCGWGWPNSYEEPPMVHDGSYDFSGWTDVRKLLAGHSLEGSTVVGLRNDGTVLDTQEYYEWCGETENVVDLFGEGAFLVAVRGDGTVTGIGPGLSPETVVEGHFPAGWEDIVQVAAGGMYRGSFFGLRSDGTLIWEDEEADLSPEAGWSDIKAIYASDNYLVALRKDGTAKAWSGMFGAMPDPDGVAEIESWEDLQGVFVCDAAVVGWKSDGSLCAVGFDPAVLP